MKRERERGRAVPSGSVVVGRLRAVACGGPASRFSAGSFRVPSPGPRSLVPAPWRRQQGFTLLEAIAAFVLLALFIGVLMSTLSTSMRNTIRAEQASLAAQWVQSKLDLVGIGEKLETGHTRGRFDDDFRWEMVVEEFDPPREEPLEIPFDPDSLGMNLYLVDLTVFWGDRGREQSAKFTTLRAYSPDQAVLFESPGDLATMSGVDGAMQRQPAGVANPRQGTSRDQRGQR